MHRILIGVVVTGALIIAGIGFAGSYAAVRELAIKKGFGNFSYVFPIGIDAGICVLLALDLLLTWIRIPFPLLRQTAWLLTAATIAFNGAAAWPDPLGVGMHAVIPVLFVVAVEAARHAIGRIADITADKHMEGVRLTRWLLSPIPTFLLWRRMKLWELRSYDQVIKLEQERLVYRARLHSRFGRAWRRKAPVESLMPLRLARYGVPLSDTAPAGLAAAGIEPALLPPAPQPELEAAPGAVAGNPAAIAAGSRAAGAAPVPQRTAPPSEQLPYPNGNQIPGQQAYAPDLDQSPWFAGPSPQEMPYDGGYDPSYDPETEYEQWYEEQLQEPPVQEPSPEDTGSFPIPVGPNRTRELGEGGGTPQPEPGEESYYQVFKQSINGSYPTPRELIDNIEAEFGISLPAEEAKRMVNRFTNRHTAELEEDHIA
ncbi:DUF2637 domain-containing protein [Streptomyces yaanensis]|uniref:DUF2637 domain-containing protein n=1 Tax=Streptomyces yaanensis TaxID=1142239 RepID=A0ABV7SLJ1_9ACTN|nr:DUF2637 domain-containing protein [Streptomyces sp. CGMCC 4.7035]WNC02985.1 DUF2637 domain-containing protein [Streptomyces sp. CGMCC 4.7035]